MPHHADPVRLACQFIRTNAHLDIGLDDIAVSARLSTRGLQHAFKKQLGTSPMTYLRNVRLARAHEELKLQPQGRRRTTVAEIARRWHFSHHSRFAALYRETYGQYPAEALRPTATPGEGR